MSACRRRSWRWRRQARQTTSRRPCCSEVRDARKNLRTALTMSQTQAARPTKPSSRTIVQPLIVEDRGVSVDRLEAGDSRSIAFTEQRLLAGFAQHWLQHSDTPSCKQWICVGRDCRLLSDDSALRKERAPSGFRSFPGNAKWRTRRAGMSGGQSFFVSFGLRQRKTITSTTSITTAVREPLAIAPRSNSRAASHHCRPDVRAK